VQPTRHLASHLFSVDFMDTFQDSTWHIVVRCVHKDQRANCLSQNDPYGIDNAVVERREAIGRELF
jgi:hypothetical protein